MRNRIFQLRNQIFQFIWFDIIKGLFPLKVGDGLTVSDYSIRIVAQLLLARLFGGPDFVIIGDSNAAKFQTLADMKRFSHIGVSCDIGIWGTRGDQWVAFFATAIGRFVIWLIGDAKVVWNIGGNHVLQRQMSSARPAYHDLHVLFPSSRIILIPPIHYSILAELGLPEAEAKENVRLVNQYARDEWGEGNYIDLYDAFMDPKTGEAFPFVLCDMVHYAPLARGVIEAVLVKVL